MTRSTGQHRFSRRVKLTAGVTGLALTVGLAIVVSGSGDQGAAKADGADKSLFVDITKVKPNVKTPKSQRGATRGTFTVDCGRNENGHFNPDNFIAAPGVQNGAQHLHDYVGNLTTDANSSDKSLDAGGTTCKNGDKSAYFWPVVRIDTGEEEEGGGDAAIECPDVAGALKNVPQQAKAEVDRNLALLGTQLAEAEKRLVDTKQAQAGDAGFVNNAILGPLKDKRFATIDRIAIAIGRQGAKPQGLEKLAPCELAGGQNAEVVAEGGEGKDEVLEGNDGEVQEPRIVDITFRGSPVGKVTAMPRFLKILYGDAKRSINGDKNTKDSWTCTGFEDKVLLNKYPICPNGSKVKRIHDFPSCWDGKNTDSANHRDHIAFPDANGRCKSGFKAVPQLRISLTYDIPADIQKAAQYKVDSFPDEEHDPFTDHDDFANVMSDQIMNRLVTCINSGKKCKE